MENVQRMSLGYGKKCFVEYVTAPAYPEYTVAHGICHQKHQIRKGDDADEAHLMLEKAACLPYILLRRRTVNWSCQ